MERIRTYDSFVVSSAGADVIPSRTGSGRSMHWLGPILSPLRMVNCAQEKHVLGPFLSSALQFSSLIPVCIVYPTDQSSNASPLCSVQRPLPQIPLLPLTVAGGLFSPNSHNTILVADYGLSSAVVFYKRSVY